MISSLYFNLSSQSMYKQPYNTNNNCFNTSKLKAELQTRLSDSGNDQNFKLSDEQKDYLRGKYNLDDMIFSIDKNLSGKTDEFMNDLYKMGVITKSELSSYSIPWRYGGKPANYDLLSPEEKKQFVIDPLMYPNGQQTSTSYILSRDVSGENIKDAFQILAIQQKRQAEIAIGENDKNSSMSYYNMYKKLSGILDDIFG